MNFDYFLPHGLCISLNLWFYNVSVIFLRLHVMTINNYVFFYFQFLFQNKWTLYTVDKIGRYQQQEKIVF